MIHLCPKCDKGLSSEEIKNKHCENCDANFNFLGTENTLDEDLFLKKFRNDIKREMYNKKRIDYYDSAINVLKASFKGIVIIRMKKRCQVYYIEDAEFKFYVCAILAIQRDIRVEFDIVINGDDIQDMRIYNPERAISRNAISRLVTRDFGRFIDVISNAINHKKKRMGHYTKKLEGFKLNKMVDHRE